MSGSAVDRLAEAIVAEGCEHMFTLMGAGNLWLIEALVRDHGVKIHHLRHENGAVGAADGAARATGGLGWCTVTQGPGFTNTITALLTAAKGRSPVILLVSDSSNLDPARFPFAGGVQALAPESILEPLGIDWVRAEGERAGEQLRETARRARSEKRTIAFIMPAGLDRIPAAPLAPAETPADLAAATPDAFAVDGIVSCIEGASHPLIVVGTGVVEAGAGEQVARLGERIGADVVTSVPASGALGAHAAVLGQFGGFSIDAAERAVQQADLLIAIGVSLNVFQTRSGAFLAGKKLVRIDLDPRACAVPAPDAGAVGDAAEVLDALLAGLGAGAEAGATGEKGPRRLIEPYDDLSEPGAIDPCSLSAALDALLPERRRIIVDNGHFGAFPMIHMRHRAPRSLIWLPDFGAVGSALAASYASATVDPSTQSVLFIGDCGLYMTLGDLETAVRERTPLIVVCMNDGAAGSELVHMTDWGVPPEQAIFGYADLAAVARGMGAQGALIREISEIEAALGQWRPEDGPLLLDCHVSRAVRSPIYDHV